MSLSARSYIFVISFLILLLPIACAASPLVISHSSNMPPLSFINDKGNPDGLLVDFWKEWANAADQKVTFDLQDWKQAVEDTVSGKADINGGMFYSKQRARRMRYGDYIYQLQGALFAAQKTMNGQKINMQEISCGVIKSGYCKIFMEANYPYTQLTIFNSMEDLIQAVSAGRVKYFVGDLPVITYHLNKRGLTKSFQTIRVLYTRNLYPTTARKNRDLINSLNLHMAAIPKEKKQSIKEKWLKTSTGENNFRKTVATCATLTFLLLVGIIKRNKIRAAARRIFNKENKN